jgi:hypothetical protein
MHYNNSLEAAEIGSVIIPIRPGDVKENLSASRFYILRTWRFIIPRTSEKA